MHTPALRTLRQRVIGICVVAATLALAPLTGATALAATGGLPGTGDRSFSPGSHAANNHCFTPSGADANEVLGVSEQLVIFDAPAEAGCGPVSTGEFWIPVANAGWITNTSFEIVPPEYEPPATTPMQDFLSKAETITYVIDSGSARERTYRYRVQDVVKIDTVDEFSPFVFGGQEPWPKPYPIAQFLAKLPPLPPGQHTYTAALHMSARTCDGLGSTEGFNCIGPGSYVLCTLPFTVTQRTPARPR